jgi:hypothetical protein
MIKFFRRIRQQLLAQNKTSKYFKYAIGEIVLVVIGILIALQINNWNENRKTKLVELELLKNIQSDLKESRHSIDLMVFNNSKQIDIYKKLLYYAREDLPRNEILDTVFGYIPTWNTPYLNYSAYETLKTKGVDLIQNNALKEKIVKIYDNEFARLIGDWDKWEWNINQTISMPFFTKHFRRDSLNYRKTVPNDYVSLMKNKEFLNIISVLLYTRNAGVDHGKRITLELDTLISAIEKEVKR